MSELRIVVPMIPPSGNHYKDCRIVFPRTKKPFLQWYHTREAEAWWWAVAMANKGQQIRGSVLEISYIVFLPQRRTDTDNYSKCIFDALTKCNAIEDDRYVDDFHGHRRIDKLNPRTVIVVKSNQEALL
jgi:Holliday junction resolvase RusA-like endonuclease